MRTRRALTFTAIICSLFFITSSLADDNSSPQITLKEKVVLLSRPPPGSTILPLSVIATPNLSKVAYSTRKDDGQFVVVNNKEGLRYDGVGHAIFSPDSQRIAYPAYRGQRMFVVFDGKEGKLFDKVEHLTFSPDSNRFAYRATKGDKQLLVIDGKEDALYDELWHALFSPDSSRFVYGARKRKKWFLVEDGKETEVVGKDPLFTFSPDSRRLGHKTHGLRGLVMTRVESFVAVDQNRFGPYDGFVTQPVFSPDSAHYAFSAANCSGGARALLVQDGKERQTGYDQIYDFAFSPDSRRLAYIATRPGRRTVVLDGKEIPSNVDIFPLGFTPDSSRFAYYESRPDGVSVVIGDTRMLLPAPLRSGPFLGLDFSKAWGVVEDGDRTYVAVNEKLGSARKRYEQLSLSGEIFNNDSTHFAFAAKRDGQWLVVIDGVEGQERFYEMVASPVFDSPTHTQMIAVQQPGHRFVRLEVQILPAPEKREAE